MDTLFVAVGLDEGVKNERIEAVLDVFGMMEVQSCVSFGVGMVKEILCLDTEMVGEEQNVFGTTL